MTSRAVCIRAHGVMLVLNVRSLRSGLPDGRGHGLDGVRRERAAGRDIARLRLVQRLVAVVVRGRVVLQHELRSVLRGDELHARSGWMDRHVRPSDRFQRAVMRLVRRFVPGKNVLRGSGMRRFGFLRRRRLVLSRVLGLQRKRRLLQRHVRRRHVRRPGFVAPRVPEPLRQLRHGVRFLLFRFVLRPVGDDVHLPAGFRRAVVLPAG